MYEPHWASTRTPPNYLSLGVLNYCTLGGFTLWQPPLPKGTNCLPLSTYEAEHLLATSITRYPMPNHFYCLLASSVVTIE
jgi:hypothetical protein